jgi:cation transport regulator ChaC
MVSSDPMRVIGVSYQAAGAKEVTLLSTPGVRVKLFDGAQLTGILFRDKGDPEEQCLSGLNVAGIVYQEEGRSKESILKAHKIAGIIYQEGDVLSYNISSGSKITGITYREADGTQVKLLSGPQLNADILNGSRITGIAYLDNSSVTVKSVREAALTGVLYRERGADKEDIVTGVRLIGIIYRVVAADQREAPSRKGVAKREVAYRNGVGAYEKNGFQKAERALLYLLPIVGVLGLVVPLVLNQSNLILVSSSLAVPLIIVPIAYLLYLRLRRKESGIQITK